MDIEQAGKASFKNRAAVAAGVDCGCYYCLTTFDGGVVQDWADGGETACCPRCSIDAVLPGVTDMELLKAAHERWFCAGD